MRFDGSNYMAMALAQALLSVGVSRPNPAVGAVVVKDGIVVGRGRTQRPGNAHAEVMALRDAGELARGAAIYVTLEPCCHYGRTPPCTKAIIEAGISKVFYAHADPNPVVRGNSRKILEDAGIQVHEGKEACIAAEFEDLEECGNGECRCLAGMEVAPPLGLNVATSGVADQGAVLNGQPFANSGLLEHSSDGETVFRYVERFYEAYDHFVRTKRTFVEIKSALTQEGAVAARGDQGDVLPIRITGDGANCWNHELRAMSDAVLVSSRTVLVDDPGLDVRLASGNNPVKVILAGHHEFSTDEVARLKIFNSEPSGIYSPSIILFSIVPQPHVSEHADAGPLCGHLEMVQLPSENFAENWEFVISSLSGRGMHRLMVEPGATLAGNIFEAGLWNRLDLWRSMNSRIDDCLDGVSLDYPEMPENMVAGESAMVGPDILTVYYPS